MEARLDGNRVAPETVGTGEEQSGGEAAEAAATDEVNAWPSGGEEMASVADESWGNHGAELPVALADGAAEADEAKPLPSLDELVQQIPSGARGLLEDLFRAKFIAVRRVSTGALKREAEPRG